MSKDRIKEEEVIKAFEAISENQLSHVETTKMTVEQLGKVVTIQEHFADTISSIISLLEFILYYVLPFLVILIFREELSLLLKEVIGAYSSLSEAWKIALFTVLVPIFSTYLITRHFYKK